jgi:hypothetical protein
MGKTDPTGTPHRQHSMLVVPIDAPGVTILPRLAARRITEKATWSARSGRG